MGTAHPTDLTNTPTTATLYFDLLGFGAADSTITIDNIALGKGNTPPVANDDTISLNQGQSLTLDLLSNDTADQPLTPSQLTLETNPTHGSLTRDEQGNLIYTPFDGYAGSNSFTYTPGHSATAAPRSPAKPSPTPLLTTATTPSPSPSFAAG